MAKSTQPIDARTEPSYGWCHWHKGTSGTAVLIELIERQSAPAYGLYACAPCREQRGLIPYAKTR